MNDFCQTSTTSDVCSHSVKSKEENMIELATILSKERLSFSIPQYNKNDISSLMDRNVNDFFYRLMNQAPFLQAENQLFTSLITAFVLRKTMTILFT